MRQDALSPRRSSPIVNDPLTIKPEAWRATTYPIGYVIPIRLCFHVG